jgi:CRISPR-associated endonuclease/helicase Cas3
MNLLAHVRQDALGRWHEHALDEHLKSVATLARSHAARFGGEWAYLAGLWHDLGKYRRRFQTYIRNASGYEPDAHIKGESSGKTPHSTAGALLACDRFGKKGRVLAYLIASHHAGLYDWTDGLAARLEDPDSRQELEESLAASPPASVLGHETFQPDLRSIPGGSPGFSLWVRMLFSALVDADFLDTERFMSPGLFEQRNQWPSLAQLTAAFEIHMTSLAKNAPDTSVNRLRSEVLAQCRSKAALRPGHFSLTVPTGGGKTLSSMAFALQHAKLHNKRRIIYVIPYTSIIEQTADVFRGIFGDAIVEHHSNAETTPENENSVSRLACENWDAPIIVTTNVQFFESLFAARPSRCRKLHNIVDSIVVLDEAQLLPPGFLQPILDVINLLAKHYGVTVVLSTATQPALTTREYFDTRQNLNGLENVREIIDDPDKLYSALERVRVRLPAAWDSTTEWSKLAGSLSRHPSVLAIVNRRQDARELWLQMPEGTLHLSALMCGAHRSQVIGEIKKRLKEGAPTRVVSTQLVEAGVDVDFPVVYRALAGLDSIAQAAGRCNREGRLDRGEVVVFLPPQPSPPGLLRKGEDACRSVLHGHDAQQNPLDRRLFARYFEQLYHACKLDEHGIGGLLKVDAELAVDFRSAAEKFRLIQDEEAVPVIVLYRGFDGHDDSADQWLSALRKHGPKRWLMRKLQRYTVNIHRQQALELLRQHDIEEVMPGLFVQNSDWLYDIHLGLNPDGNPALPSATIA